LCGWTELKAGLDARIRKAGTIMEPWVHHDIRRSVATHLAEIGTPPHIIEATLNHVSGHKAGVAGIYNRSEYDLQKRQALARWGEHLLDIVHGRDAKVVPLRA
jgi:integrase